MGMTAWGFRWQVLELELFEDIGVGTLLRETEASQVAFSEGIQRLIDVSGFRARTGEQSALRGQSRLCCELLRDCSPSQAAVLDLSIGRNHSRAAG